MQAYKNIINKFKNKKILVVGDLILDQYIQGTVTRISPEAPVPVLLENESFFTLGGAANVANNLQSLGAKVTMVGCLGDDEGAKTFKSRLKQKGISSTGIFTSKKHPTILKIRIMSQHQQIVRVDREKVSEGLDKEVKTKITKFVQTNASKFDAFIISDYGKGVVTPELVTQLVELARENSRVITVDPKDNHFAYYENVSAITPNLKEIENAIKNIKITAKDGRELNVHVEKLKNSKHIDQAGKEILSYLNLESLLLTLGEDGMRIFEKGKKPISIKTKAREVFDVSGAGDTVISVYTLGLTVGATKRQAADIANSAAGVVVGKMGAVAISKDELVAAVKGL